MIKNLLLSSIFLIGITAFSQNISGKYQRKDKFSGGEESYIVTFNIDSTFEDITIKNLGISTKSIGDYLFKGDTLILNYHESKMKEVLIQKKEKIKQNNISYDLLTNLFINIHDRDGKRNEDAILHFKDDKDYFLALPINSNIAFSLYNDQLKSFVISSLGRHDIKVDLEPLLGYSSTIDIYLSKTKYERVYPFKQKFLIKDLDNGYLNLVSTDKNGASWILEKI